MLRQAQHETIYSDLSNALSVRPEPVEGLRMLSLLLRFLDSSNCVQINRMSFWVYILQCADRSYYTGHTDNLEVRIAKHQSGEIEGYTSSRLPARLCFTEEFATREEALSCERQIKGWSRKKKEALMRRDWNEISRLGHGAPKSTGVHPSTSSGRTDSHKKASQ